MGPGAGVAGGLGRLSKERSNERLKNSLGTVDEIDCIQEEIQEGEEDGDFRGS